jgi:hypothetical protein
MPTTMYIGFSGGVVSWGTLCGALVAPIALISGVVPDKKFRDMLTNELMAWYIQHPFPDYQPANLNLAKVPVGSTLCHQSVTNWCKVQGVDAQSKEKKERCAGVTADTVRQTVLMLNTYADTGTFTSVHKPDPIVATCMGCHKEATQPFTQGKENCMTCHGSKLIEIDKCGSHKDLI